MSVARSLMLAAALVLALSTLAESASRPRYRNESSSAYGAEGISRAPAAGSNGGYSSNPQMRALEALADRYRPGW